MAKEKGKGSILLEILIVILVLALIGTILYPKRVWEQSDSDTLECRMHMEKILKTELIYMKYNNTYQDTLDKVISFIKDDTTNTLVLEYLYADTALADKILNDLTSSYPEADNKVKTFMADTMLSTILYTTRYDSHLAKVTLDRLENTQWKDSVLAARDTDSTLVYALDELAQKVPSLDIVEPLENDDSLSIVLERIA